MTIYRPEVGGWKDITAPITVRGVAATDPTWARIGTSNFWAYENDANAADDVEVVGFLLSGTWAGVTATLQVCMDSSASPRVFANVPAASFTQDVADSWHIPSGAYFRLNVTGAGSPLSALTFAVRGDINRA